MPKLVTQVNERFARISERFQRVDEDAEQEVKHPTTQMAADDALRVDLRGHVDDVRRPIDFIHVGGAKWAKRGFVALVIGW